MALPTLTPGHHKVRLDEANENACKMCSKITLTRGVVAHPRTGLSLPLVVTVSLSDLVVFLTLAVQVLGWCTLSR